MMQMQGLPRALFFTGLATMFGTIMVAYIIVPGIVHWQITQMIRLEPGNDVWNAWSDVKAPIFLHAYVFNITNHEDVLNGEIPKIQELGPYVYEQKRTKDIIKVDLENGTVIYKPTMLHFFRPDLSNGTEEDPITMINVPLLSVAHELGSMSRMIRYMARVYIDSFEEQPFMHTNVGTVLFKGSHVPMIESISELMGRELLPNNTFAFFIERNGTSPDNFEVDTGVLDSKGFGDIKSWRGKHDMDIWDGPTCNMINGTDFTIYAPFVTKQRVIRVFEAEKTGVVIKGNKRIQLNVKVQPSDAIDVYNNLPDVYLPVVWLDEVAVQEEKQLQKIRYMLVLPLTLLEYFKWSILAVSCMLIVVGIVMFFMQSPTKDKKGQPKEQEKFLYL